MQRPSGATDSGVLARFPMRGTRDDLRAVRRAFAWLEPSLILDAHAWPQWDVWILPFYLFATLAA